MRSVCLAGLFLLLVAVAACPDNGGPGSGDASPSSSATDSPVPSPSAEPGFSVLALNLHCLKLDGTPYGDNPARAAAIADAVMAEGVAVLLLQEVCDNGSEDMQQLLEAALAQRSGADWFSYYGWAHTGWEGTPDEAEEGLAVLARVPLGDGAELEHRVQAGLRRVAVAATLSAELGGLRVVSVHYDVGSEPARTAQSRETASWMLLDQGYDLLIGGDFNDIPDSATHRSATAMGFRDLSESLDAGRIDHIMLHRGAAFAGADAELIFVGNRYPPVSDHPGVLVRVVPDQGEAVTRTTLIADYDAGFGNTLWVRGDVVPLSWSYGLPAHAVAQDRWMLVLTEIPSGDFELKFLVDDEDWQLGSNETATAGQESVFNPTF